MNGWAEGQTTERLTTSSLLCLPESRCS